MGAGEIFGEISFLDSGDAGAATNVHADGEVCICCLSMVRDWGQAVTDSDRGAWKSRWIQYRLTRLGVRMTQ